MFKNLNEREFIKQIIGLFKKKAEKNNRIDILFADLENCFKF